jgi:hypothetical protein
VTDVRTGDRIDQGTLLVGESTSERRERMARLQTEAVERRQQELREQSSPLSTPSARIRLWEQLHQLALPSNLAHRLLEVIAADTGLSVEEVRAERRLRDTATPESPKI